MGFIKSLYLNGRLFFGLGTVVVLFILAFFFPFFGFWARLALMAILAIFLLDIVMLYSLRGITASRVLPERLSNGDKNEIVLAIKSRYAFPIKALIIDEVPAQFQARDVNYERSLPRGGNETITYHLRPVERGEYHFGRINVFAQSPLSFIRRRYAIDAHQMVPVYPSYLQLRKYELMATSNRLMEYGIKKVRRLGHTMEFEQIKEYVPGDDYRTVNWKATARQGDLMVNQYQDEQSQQVYSIIDKGRVMKMPFEGMTLLDYAINATLVLSRVILMKHDRAGLITFSTHTDRVLPAERKGVQMNKIVETLYNVQTDFSESNFEHLYAYVRRKITQRSLLVLYTNFESVPAMKRQLPFLSRLAKNHLLVVVFFENTEMSHLLDDRPEKVIDIYYKTIAEKFAYEKRQIVKELAMHGIQAILTPPEHLTINTLNKYLELKSRGMV